MMVLAKKTQRMRHRVHPVEASSHFIVAADCPCGWLDSWAAYMSPRPLLSFKRVQGSEPHEGGHQEEALAQDEAGLSSMHSEAVLWSQAWWQVRPCRP